MRQLRDSQAGPLRLAAHLASPGGRRGSLLVLIYHRVLPEPDPLLPDEPDASRFIAQMDLVSSLFNVIALTEAAERLATESLPARAVAITFDDGYANNLTVAAPILAQRGLRATCFVSTGFIGRGAMWNDIVIEALRCSQEGLELQAMGLGTHRLSDADSRRGAIDAILAQMKYLEVGERLRLAEALAEHAGLSKRPDLMMTEPQLRELAALGVEIGAHCVTHPILSRLEPAVARREIADSKSRLESILGTPVRCFAYPNGRPGRDYGPEHVAMARDAGFVAAVSTAWGAATRVTDPLEIPRVAPWDHTPGKYALRLIRAFRQQAARP